MTLDTIQYNESPLGKVREKKPIINGIIHSIMVWFDCCRGSADGMMVIFCWTQVVTNTKAGINIGEGSGTDRSIHRNWGFMGAAAKATENGATGYIFSANPTSLSGVLNRV